ncbi:MAG: tRNA pseudouridine(55) synthase TruB [Solirubrobacterales bacterium]|nr:tRNA pseudouridine(55) synthase TruB [Solirubrobacterales bacterium]
MPPSSEAPAAAALLADKPPGVTSHDLVAEVRRERGGKVGHAGTLDPFATGLLIVLLGRATRLQRYLVALPKTYLATARLGWRSSTGDPDGELTETGRVPEALVLPTGEVSQQLPMTSAVKVGGERLYRKAHRGEEVETPIRLVTVHRAELLGSDAEHASFEIECSSGTYVRTLIETLEDAYCEALRRLAIGSHRVVDGRREEISVEALMAFLPERPLDEAEADRVGHGIAVPLEEEIGERRARLTHEGRILAIGRPEGRELRPEVVLV